jgi:hypothetical protein
MVLFNAYLCCHIFLLYNDDCVLKEIFNAPCWRLILPPFQIVGRFGKFRYIVFAMYLDIVYI